MTLDTVKEALQKVLDKVQDTSGLAKVKLNDSDIPSNILEGFDSTIWPVATSWLAKELNVEIPKTVHIFGKTNKQLLDIGATCKLVMAKYKIRAPMLVAAE